MRRIFSCTVALSVILFAAAAHAQYSVSASDARSLRGIDFSKAELVGQDLTQTYQACDQSQERGGCFTDPAHNTAILKFADGTFFFDAKMAIDADGSALSKRAERPNQPETAFRYPESMLSLDSEHVPYIVIPMGSFRQVSGVTLGDMAAVVKDGQVHFAIVGDVGPRTHIGEGSMALHAAFGHLQCQAHDDGGNCSQFVDTSIDPPVLYFLFPDTKKLIFDGLTPENINERLVPVGQQLWTDFLHRQQTEQPKQKEGADAHRLP